MGTGIGPKGDLPRNIVLGASAPASRLPEGVPITTETGTPQRYTRALEERRAEIDRLDSNAAKQYHHIGDFAVTGVGEVEKVLYFPVRFVEKPLVSFGWDLAEDSNYVPGSIPWCSVGVIKWDIEIPNEGEDQMRQYWNGARLGIVVAGPINTNINVHFHFTGIGLVNPSGDLPPLDLTL